MDKTIVSTNKEYIMYTCPECKEKLMSKSDDKYHCPLCLRSYRLDVRRRQYVMVKKTNN